ncbi:DUF488 domain-containing protein [Phosphitispora fastidiosa]|uniref:DUF488 domain-containing protein n=1 Tax=Phosphitispora fastidiosa TaxID=2837202 RepID=UPI001E5A8128|nr:DUF488 domain-containing protein [Phosphitispora fastidiosa]MBU7006761.1 protein of unknown function (DUF488 family) [Phosphitispora fastidiosa]
MSHIYTIGHSIHSVEHFLLLLNSNGINCVVDVRSVPYSKYSPQYNMNELRQQLKSNGIYYVFMGKELGARQSDKSLYNDDGYVDFERVRNSTLFKTGIERVKAGMKKGFKIALMCTEKDPIECHRNILVARAFYLQNYPVLNILENGAVETQDHLENRLLDKYFPNRNQRNILELLDGEINEKDMIIKAYRERNKEIGYKNDDGSQVI